jgi:succinate dehydrogenase/fumarate reductase flavoprotein subunit
MTRWQDYVKEEGSLPDWPYPIKYGQEQEIDVDVLVLGGGIGGCWAAISAARSGLKVALVEKGDVQRSGAGGPGCDHWCNAPANPLSNVDPDEWAVHMADRPFSNGIGIQIQNREDWDTLLELEQMGAKIRDTKDEYVGAIGRDPKTKLMISPRYTKTHSYVLDYEKIGKPKKGEKLNNVVIRIWGSTFKPVLKKECKRLGVQIFDRVMATSLLTENGVQGGRVVGAMGFSNRTGEVLVFKSKATIMATAGGGGLYTFSSELCGISSMGSRTATGEGIVMAYNAGAELANMEASGVLGIATGFKHKWYSGAGDASYENVPLVDAKGKRLPLPTQGWEDWGAMVGMPGTDEKIREGVMKGEYELPFYGDFPAMSDVERRATWDLMLKEESTTKIIMDQYNQHGYDGSRDLLQSYKFIEGKSLPQWGEGGHGGALIVDWNLKTTLDGLYAAGGSMFSAEDHSYCAATGRYAGRKAVDYAKTVKQGKVSRDQVEKEKARILAPTKRSNGIEWKELNVGINKVMQYYVSEYRTESLFDIALQALNKIEKESVPTLYAMDPHKLMRSLEDVSILNVAKLMITAMKHHKSSNPRLNLMRIDYPQIDPPEKWKFSTIKQVNGKPVFGTLPMVFWGNMKEQYEAHNKDYAGVYKGK